MSNSKILSIVVVPALLFITGLIACLTIQQGWNFELVSIIIFLFSAIYILWFEHLIPFKKQWCPSKSSFWINLKHLLFSAIIFDALGKAMALSFVLWSKRLFFDTSKTWNNLPLFLVFLIATLIGEFLPYVYHRLSHIGKENSYISLLLWRIHSIHHIPKSLNWFKTSWIHPINMFLNTFLKITPLLLLGFSEDILFLVGISHVVISYISHANIQSKTGMLDYIITTPKIHQFHHSKNLEEAKNFGNILPYWDIVFNTYYNRKGNVDKVGLAKSNTEYPKERKYLNQLIFPFSNLFKNCCAPVKN
ncbi:sterol desaturase family protein [Aquimarina sp. 2201CG1-2-11]|uniref:sterol desaturase family protein n=1 Tax=Aquimarina discodermiae TaxID=3231043 RepID=UPI003462C05A